MPNFEFFLTSFRSLFKTCFKYYWKDLKVLKILLQKNFNHQIYNRNGVLVALLILSLPKANSKTDEKDSKWGIIYL